MFDMLIAKKMTILTALAAISFGVTGLPAYGQPAAASASAARGKLLFLRCASCHAVEAGAPARIGPNLAGIVGRKAGALPGYDYSPALQASSLIWDEATLDRWLADSGGLVPGNRMAFAGLAKAADRAAVIAYLKTGAR